MNSGPLSDDRQRWLMLGRSGAEFVFCLLPLASGLALGAIFDGHLSLSWTWVALVPLVAAAAWPRKRLTRWLGIWLAGGVFHYWGLSWLREMENSLIGAHSAWWFLLATIQGTAWLIAAAVARDVRFRLHYPWCGAWILGWTVGEFARFHLWAMVDEVGTPWLQLALVQVEHPQLLQVADLGGAWLLGGLIAGANALWLDLGELGALLIFRNRRSGDSYTSVARPLSGVVLGVALATAVWVYGTWRLAQVTARPGPTIELMPTSCFGPNGLAPAADYVLAGPGEVPPDLMVFPEMLWIDLYPSPVNVAQTAANLAHLQNWSKHANAALVLGCNRQEHGPAGQLEFNSAVLVDRERGAVGWYDKLSLVPWQEFTPWWTYTAFRQAPSEFTPGRRAPVHSVWWPNGRRQVSLAVAICYDMCFPQVLRRYFHEPGQVPPEFFSVCSSEHLDRELRGQRALLAHARLRAVECRRAVARSVDNGFSALIDSNGSLRYLASQVTKQEPTSVGAVPLDDRYSLYRAWGDWVPSAAVAIWMWANRPRFHSRSGPPWPSAGSRWPEVRRFR